MADKPPPAPPLPSLGEGILRRAAAGCAAEFVGHVVLDGRRFGLAAAVAEGPRGKFFKLMVVDPALSEWLLLPGLDWPDT